MMRYIEAEHAVLGGIMLVNEAYWRVADLLGSDDFASPECRALWDCVTELSRAGSPCDAVTVGERNQPLASIAIEYANATPSAANIRAYAEIVSREAVARRVRAAGKRIASLAGEDVLGEAQRIIGACAPRVASAIKPLRAFLAESTALMAARCEQVEALTGVPTSLEWLDEQTAGWQRGDLILIGARPSIGKTALAVQYTLFAAKTGHPVLFLSLEMGGAQLCDRMLAHVSGVDSQLIRQPQRMDESHWPKITQAGFGVGELPIRIDETSALTVDAIGARVRQANATQRLGLVVVDYLTLIAYPKADKVTDAIQIITRSLKLLAKELKVPIMLLSQLNRGGEHKPTLASLRESGAIEQDADVVILLHRPSDDNRSLIECNVAKQRNGPTGETFLHFDGATQRFTQTDERPVATVAIPRRRGMQSSSAPTQWWCGKDNEP